MVMLLDTELAAIGVESYIRNWAAINHANSQTVECCCLAARIGVTQPNHKTALADRPTDRPTTPCMSAAVCQRRGRTCSLGLGSLADIACAKPARARAVVRFPPKATRKVRERARFLRTCVSSLSSGGAQIKLCHHTTHAHTHHHRRKCAPPRVSHRVHRGESHAHSHRTPDANEIPARGGAPFRATEQRRQTRNRCDFCVLLF